VPHLPSEDRNHVINTRYNDDLPVSHDDWAQYWNVLSSACDVYIDREKVRHGLWKSYNAAAQMTQVKIKSERVLHALDHSPEHSLIMMAELEDIINYSVFAYRKIDGTV